MKTFILEEINAVSPLLSEIQSAFFSENCIVGLENHNHETGCVLNVTGDLTIDFKIEWTKTVNRAGYQEEKKVVEHTAEAISFFLSHHLTEYEVAEEALIGTGFDYWLCYKTNHNLYNPLNFMQARLEVSGINTETAANTVKQRIKEKKTQTNVSDVLNLPAYISIVELSIPKAYFAKK
jgi:hypothetical protein